MTATETTVGRTEVPAKMTVETSLLIDALKGGKAADVRTDEVLSAIVGKPVAPTMQERADKKPNAAGNLASAIRYLIRTGGPVWQRIRGAGCVKCLTAPERLDAAQADMASARRKSRLAVQKIGTLKIEELEAARRPEVLALGVQLRALCEIGAPATQKKLVARNVSEGPDPKALLAAFAKV